MHRDRRAHLVEPIDKEQLHGLGDPPIDQPLARWPDPAVRDLANPIVREIPALASLRANNLPSPQLVERGHERVLFRIAHAGEDGKREVTANRGGHFCGATRLLGQQRQPGGNHGLDLRQSSCRPLARPPRGPSVRVR